MGLASSIYMVGSNPSTYQVGDLGMGCLTVDIGNIAIENRFGTTQHFQDGILPRSAMMLQARWCDVLAINNSHRMVFRPIVEITQILFPT